MIGFSGRVTRITLPCYDHMPRVSIICQILLQIWRLRVPEKDTEVIRHHSSIPRRNIHCFTTTQPMGTIIFGTVFDTFLALDEHISLPETLRKVKDNPSRTKDSL